VRLAVTFEEYARERVSVLLGLAFALCGNRSLAEDLVQDVLLKTFRAWKRIEQLDVPDAYVRKMLVNEHLSWRRKWSRLVPRAEVEPESHVLDLAEQSAERRVLRDEIGRLPRRQQTVLGLRYYGGMSDTEIAAAMGCSPGTVRGYASRALRTLRVELADEVTVVEGRAR
jgi:RNA polymerase sigma-70 factor (sigma-E family)